MQSVGGKKQKSLDPIATNDSNETAGCSAMSLTAMICGNFRP
jgi:hypothetical protein